MKIWALGLALVSTTTFGLQCQYERHSPGFLKKMLIYELAVRGVNVLPAQEVWKGEYEMGDLAAVRGGNVLGFVRTTESPTEFTDSISITTLRGRHLFRAVETRRHSSYKIDIFPEIDDVRPQLSVSWSVKMGTKLWVDNENLGPTTFYTEFGRAWTIVLKALTLTTEGAPVYFERPIDRFWYGARTSFELAPYLDLLGVLWEDGRYVIRGTVGSYAAYHKLTNLALALSPSTRVVVTINQLIASMHPPLFERPPRCEEPEFRVGPNIR